MEPLSEEQTVKVVAMAMDLAREGGTVELLEFIDHGLPVDSQDAEAGIPKLSVLLSSVVRMSTCATTAVSRPSQAHCSKAKTRWWRCCGTPTPTSMRACRALGRLRKCSGGHTYSSSSAPPAHPEWASRAA